ncbi:MAG: BREX system P-loop protein BrxC [Anaerolineales bacterium]|nr:BREX system P-loop protein BrxC [Anaerolineales bacterium]
MTQIQDLFVNPIHREITTVITMDDLRLKEIEQELSEYVVTDSIEELLIEFLERYVETRTGQTNRIGVWISGFFGSGKSHFAKILSYLLENRTIGNWSAVDLLKLRILESSQRGEIERLLHQAVNFIDTETIAFQIKTEEDLLSHVPTPQDAIAGNHISTIMYRQWLEKRGLSTTLWVARLELELIQLGYYEAFKAKINELEDLSWGEVRQHDMLVRDAAISALCAILPDRYTSEERASKAIDDIQAGLKMGPSILADELSNWVESRRQSGSEKTPHLVYIIDEMGQFIGDSNQRLLELQSIAEAFASNGLGKLWLIVTAQEALEEIVRDAIRRENEFDKIRDRFNLRLGLTSENIEKVLQERILKKKEARLPELQSIYAAAGGNIATVCTLQGANRPLPQADEGRFASDYPFPPYHLAILQHVFAAVRTPGGEKEKIEGTERSLIGVTQAILKSPATGFATSSIGRMVAFDEIYDQIETELPGIDRRTIDEVQLGDQPTFFKRILKALYLIQKLEWIPSSAENLARLLVNDVDDPQLPFSVLKKQVRDGLEALNKGHYVVERDGKYEFLSGVKKDIEMNIAAVNVTINDRRREIKKYFKTVLDIGRLNYQNIRRFDTVVRGDDDVIYDKGEITLQVYSPIYVSATDLTREEVLQRSFGDNRTLYWFPAQADELYRELGKLIQTEAVVSRRMSRQDKSPEEESILFQKQRDVDISRGKVQTLLRGSLLNGTIIYDGEVKELEGRTTNLNTVFTREVSQVIPHVYTRFEPAAVRVDEKNIERLLTVNEAQLTDVETDLSLFDDAYRINRHAPVVNEMLEELRLRARAGDPSDGKNLADFFEKVPYGWDPILVRIVLAALFRAGVISLKFEGRPYHDFKVTRAQELLTKANSFRKTEFIYDPQEGLTPNERREVQKAIDRIFHRMEPDTVNIMASALEEELEKVNDQNTAQSILVQERKLPVKPVLLEGQALIQEILDTPQADRRLKTFLGKAEKVKALKNYQGQLQDFIDAKRQNDYGRAQSLKSAVHRASSVIPQLADSQVKSWLDEMEAIEKRKEIVEKWAIYYQNMQPLLQSYQAAYEIQHQARFEAYAQVKAELEALDVTTEALENRLCEGPVGWSLDGLACTTCSTGLETLYYQTQSAQEEKVRLIDLHQQPDEQGPDKPAYEILRLHTAIHTRDINSEEDLEAALDELRGAVKTMLDEGKRVILG